MKIKPLFLLISVLISSQIYADELDDALGGFDEPSNSSNSTELDDILDGFDEPSSDATASLEPQLETIENVVSVSGYYGFSSSYNYAHSTPASGEVDYQGLSKLKFSANIMSDFEVNADWKARVELKLFADTIYSLNDRDEYNDDILDTYESDIAFNEVYISGSLTEAFDLKFGRQIVVWGKSDNIRVADMINPLDNREPGMVDIEDLRIPVLMTKLSYYSGDWSYTLMAIHEQRNPIEAAIDSEFFPTAALPFSANFVLPDVGEGDIDFAESTFAFSADGRFSGWDLSLYAARVTDSRWHFEENKTVRDYGLIDMTGVAGNVVLNGFLLKAEVALIDNLVYNTTTDKKSRTDSLIGVEYMGITDWTLSAEYAIRKIDDYETQMINSPDMVEETSSQLSLRASYSFDHDNATLSFLNTALGDGGEQGGFNRLWLDYAINDQLELSTGVIDYQSGTNLIWNAISDNDRLFFNARYNF
ncbi:MAG: DUF1302 domain-containing protein [Gammaproteobacteria bacterium]|nr:DUF1302 domain-containing protein [Gammaproteobacteria bacterium]